jgi:hypothetical protein
MPASLEEMLSLVGAPAGGDDDPLELSSLQVLLLVEEIEISFALKLAASEVRRETFATRRALRALLLARGCTC